MTSVDVTEAARQRINHICRQGMAAGLEGEGMYDFALDALQVEQAACKQQFERTNDIGVCTRIQERVALLGRAAELLTEELHEFRVLDLGMPL